MKYYLDTEKYKNRFYNEIHKRIPKWEYLSQIIFIVAIYDIIEFFCAFFLYEFRLPP